MKKTIIIVVAVVATCFLTWSLVRSDNHEPAVETVDENRIILAEFSWNGEPHQISLADLDAAIAELPPYRQRNLASKADKAEFLEEFIDKKLKLLQAADAGFDTLPDHLAKMEDYTHQLMVEKLTEVEVDAKTVYTDEDLLAYYEEHKSNYIEAAKARATCITFDDEDLANQTLDEIKAGKDLAEVAKALAAENKLANGPGTNQEDPGNTFFFSKTASANWTEFIEAVFAQEIGEMTETVFETDVNEETYYLIFRKEEHQSERQKTFDEVKSDVEKKVERAKKRERILAWIAEISEAGKLKTYPDNIPAPAPVEEPEKAPDTPDE